MLRGNAIDSQPYPHDRPQRVGILQNHDDRQPLKAANVLMRIETEWHRWVTRPSAFDDWSIATPLGGVLAVTTMSILRAPVSPLATRSSAPAGWTRRRCQSAARPCPPGRRSPHGACGRAALAGPCLPAQIIVFSRSRSSSLSPTTYRFTAVCFAVTMHLHLTRSHRFRDPQNQGCRSPPQTS